MKNFDYLKFHKLLNDKNFYAQLLFISFIVNKLNEFNIKFHNQSFEVSEVKAKIKECYNLILSYILLSEKLNFEIEKFIQINWINARKQKEWFYKDLDFIDYLTNELEPEQFKILKDLDSDEHKKFYKVCCTFIGKICNLFPYYFNFEKDILDTATFLELKGRFQEIKSKMIEFGKYFNILNESNMPQLHDELVKLFSNPILSSYKEAAENKTLKLWDLIDETEINLLRKIVNTAHSLPTTSATIEQAFSIIKLLKTDKQNQLSNESVEALMLISQEYKSKGAVNLTEKMLIDFQAIKSDINIRKSNHRNPINNNSLLQSVTENRLELSNHIQIDIKNKITSEPKLTQDLRLLKDVIPDVSFEESLIGKRN